MTTLRISRRRGSCYTTNVATSVVNVTLAGASGIALCGTTCSVAAGGIGAVAALVYEDRKLWLRDEEGLLTSSSVEDVVTVLVGNVATVRVTRTAAVGVTAAAVAIAVSTLSITGLGSTSSTAGV